MHVRNGVHLMRYALGMVLLSVAGCATVEPEKDYARAEELMVRATGYARLYDPARLKEDARFVEALLADGLTADEAAQVALVNNTELQAALYDIGVARADWVQSGLLSNPSLAIALRFPSAGGLANIDFDLAQTISDLWQMPARQEAAEHRVQEMVLKVAWLGSGTTAEAKEAYYRVLGAERRLAIARENVEIGGRVMQLVEQRRDAGRGSDLDVNLARGVSLEAELGVKRARLGVASARRTLATTLGLSPAEGEFELVDSLPESPSDVVDDEKLVRLAWAERLDVKAVRRSVDRAEEQLVLEYRRVLPNVAVGLSFEREARKRSGDQGTGGDEGTDIVIGPALSLEIPIFDQNQAQVAKARFELERRLRLIEGLERTLGEEVIEAADQARTAWEIARFYREEVVPQADRSLEMSRESFNAGRSTVLSVLDAERTFLAAGERYAEALEKAAAVMPALERVVGVPLGEMEKRIETLEAED